MQSPPPHRAPRALASSLAAALLSLSSAGPARADEVRGTRSELLREASHLVDVQIDRGAAKLVIRRTVFNGGARHDQAMFWIDVPAAGVATGLRTLGVKDGAPFWFTGELMEAEAAAARYRELTGIGGYYPKDPALLSWRSQDLLALQVFPCAPKQQKTIEYTLEAPASYSGGRYHVALPRTGTAALAAMATLSPARAGDLVFVDGERAAPGVSVRLERDITLAIAPRGAQKLEGGLASIPLTAGPQAPCAGAPGCAAAAPGRAIVRVHFEAAPRLSEVPRGAGVVIVLDASRSLGEAEGAALVAAARAYLSHFDTGRAEVLTFDREVHGLNGQLVPVQQALAQLGRLTLSRQNGNRVDDALARADALLAALPTGTPRRIVVLTDLRTRASLAPERLQGTLRSGAIVHVGAVTAGDPRLHRNDEGPWAGVARATGGLLWRAGATPDAARRRDMRRAYEELARPVRIHHPVLTAAGIGAEELASLPYTFDEGEGYAHLAIHAAPAARVELSGELWSSPIRKVLEPDEAEGRRWSALVFGSTVFHALKEPEMMALALRGRAVSPVTSYLAIEPGVRPSTEGLDWSNTGQGFGSGSGRLGGSHRTKPPRIRGFDPASFLRNALEPGWQACGGAGRAATVTIETTLQEVVDVPSSRVEGGTAAFDRCLAEAAWAIDLPAEFDFAWSSYTISL